MNASAWMVPVLTVVVLLAAAGIALLARAWPRPGLSPEESRELSGGPMPPLKKRAWYGLAVALATTVTVTGMVAGRGAEAYWNDDPFRLTVMMIFIGGLVAHSILTGALALKHGRPGAMDERDRAILARAPMAQIVAIMFTLAGWLVTLGERFHEQGAIPMVYMYLLFGSIFLAMMIAHSLGILLLYWISTGHGEN